METPHQLSRQAIEEFRAIYQEEFGEVLSDGEAQEAAMRLLRLFGVLVKPNPDIPHTTGVASGHVDAPPTGAIG